MNKNNNILFLILGGILLAGLLVFLFLPGLDANQDGQNGEPPSGFQQYTSTQMGFEIVHPNDARVSMETDNRIKFTFLGPDSEPNTEITDGFTVTVHYDPDAAQYTELETYAESRAAAHAQGERADAFALAPRTIGDKPTYAFEYETMLGPVVTEHVFMPEPGRGYEVTHLVSGSSADEYENMIMTMLQSLTFIEPDSEPVEPIASEAVAIALLDYRDVGEESDGKERGCDRVVMVSRQVAGTQAPLTAALNELFSLESEDVAGWKNFIAKTNDTLSFERATVEDGTASVYLTGELSGLAGVCDNPRATIQIEETALQFDTVDEVQIYLNDEETDLTPDGRGA